MAARHFLKTMKSRRSLQIVMGTLATAPLLSGIVGLAGIYNPMFGGNLPVNLILDSNLRFLNATSVAVAISIYFLLPVIEKQTFACRIICFTIFLGGAGRLISIRDLGTPPWPLLVFMCIELTSPVLLVLWQKRVQENCP